MLPVNEVARKYMLEAKKRKRALKKRQEEASKGQKRKSEGLNYSKIISAVCVKHNSINPMNVGSLTYYQLLDQFKMIMDVENYNTEILFRSAGASGNDKLKHYTASS